MGIDDEVRAQAELSINAVQQELSDPPASFMD